ncbi:hypothetical protein KUTeg_017612 [Tegillarca granosa]|uniref:F5/8 type C domain-containing protein n=1 Tax=Tegillarca granosa TaxID=220873 RepID=A0ABQ9EFE7_TEGGR|nr:hypothetical protein KUTeg_017612 [Tegillarca granosa]
MFDGEEDTCWNSDQGSPQWVYIEFNKEVELNELHIRFQGGFAGKDCEVHGSSDGGTDLIKILDFYPEDKNRQLRI